MIHFPAIYASSSQARSLRASEKELPPSMWAQLMHNRLTQEDCANKVRVCVCVYVCWLVIC